MLALKSFLCSAAVVLGFAASALADDYGYTTRTVTTPGRYETRMERVEEAGRWVTEQKVVQTAGRYETQYRDVTIPGRWETVERRVVIPGRWVERGGPSIAVGGKKWGVEIDLGGHGGRQWIPERVETVCERIWIEPRCERQAVQVWVPGCSTVETVRVWQPGCTTMRPIQVWIPARTEVVRVPAPRRQQEPVCAPTPPVCGPTAPVARPAPQRRDRDDRSGRVVVNTPRRGR